LKYHLVWIKKYPKQLLTGLVADRLRELIRQICKANDIEIIKGHISKDHVHLFVCEYAKRLENDAVLGCTPYYFIYKWALVMFG